MTTIDTETAATPPAADAPTRAFRAWNRGWSIALGAALLLTFAVFFARPVQDADLWWQMAYGRSMLQDRTLIPDHSTYSWTPAANDKPYCSWVVQIGLYLLYRLGGLPLLFALRYVCMASLPVLMLWLAWKKGFLRHPLTWLVTLLAILMSPWGLYLKAQLASFVLMTVTVAVWFGIRNADRAQRNTLPWCYALPPIMLLWVNCHGGFMFGVVFLILAEAGEEMNALFAPEQALSLRTRRHLFAALVLSAGALCLTPYGFGYLLDLPQWLLGSSMEELKTVRDYDSIFLPSQRGWYFVETGAAALVILLVLAPALWRRKHPDWMPILTNIAFAVLYTRLMRTTLYWAPVFGFTAIQLLPKAARWLQPRRRLVAGAMATAITAVFLWFAGRTVHRAVTRPNLCSWFGFGVSYVNPLEEAEFIEKHLAGRRLGNDYNAGGYLLWRLWPQTKVFIDPRYFPYKSWYAEYRALESGVGIRKFLNKYRCDAWCIVFPLKNSIAWFRQSPDWVPVFYGASAAVFVRRDLLKPGVSVRGGDGLDDIRNLYQGFLVLSFACNIQDWPNAERIATGLEKRFFLPKQRQLVAGARAMLRGAQAYYRHDYELGVKHLEEAAGSFADGVAPMLGACYHHLAAAQWRHNDVDAALRLAQEALRVRPEDLVARHNLGVLAWYRYSRDVTAEPAVDWQTHLTAFVKDAQKNRAVPASTIADARAMLAGTYTGRPRLLLPSEPQSETQ